MHGMALTQVGALCLGLAQGLGECWLSKIETHTIYFSIIYLFNFFIYYLSLIIFREISGESMWETEIVMQIFDS